MPIDWPQCRENDEKRKPPENRWLFSDLRFANTITEIREEPPGGAGEI